jgi:hypothetical protein
MLEGHLETEKNHGEVGVIDPWIDAVMYNGRGI